MARRKAQRRKGRNRRRRRSIRRILWRALGGGAAAALLLTVIPIALFRYVPPPTSAFMLLSRRADPATGQPCARIEQRWVPGDALPRNLAIAVLVAEDQRFLQHHGFDLKAISDAVDDQRAGRRLRGASTVSQQVAKNLFLWPGRSLVRKALEAWFTGWLELLWTKQRILDVHLNFAQFGPCVFGAEAASQRYFGHAANALTPYQAALLATVLPSPGNMRVDDPGPYTRERALQILEAMELPHGPGYLRGL
jgi:monofunctional biosynthetic peptidoglycan transglycosylase